ncbi:uncharacterized protein LOC122520877 [Polistes fuscatus]|uniref:uncharacterized protein LOC122520877 n=1 Tax=Polistes fuscatus TaxID=30207 RepID=UPI001CA8EADF|nr:uncharacterized protein LOC122520877 [Polistes fuscatus]
MKQISLREIDVDRRDNYRSKFERYRINIFKGYQKTVISSGSESISKKLFPEKGLLKFSKKTMMDDEASIFWASILMVCGSVMMVILLTCYICLFRDLCCPARDSTKRRRTIRRNTMQVTEENNLQKFDEIPMNEITQGDSSMPTESEKF